MPDNPTDVVVSRDVLIEEMQFILSFLLEQGRSGKRIRLSDARSRLTGRLTLDFADYFKFLKRYNYVVINRTDHGLAVTDEGKALSADAAGESFAGELKQHFGDQVEEGQELIEMRDDAFTATRAEPDGDDDPAGTAAESVAEPEPARPSRRAPSREARSAPKGTKYDTKYTRYESIGSGGIGTVYRGRLNSLALDVAIKEIKELFSYFNFLQRSEVIRHLRDVVGQMAVLQHPLVVKVIDQNTDVAHPYFVTEFLTGGNLRDQMEAGDFELDRALILFTQICYALQAAHAEEVLHGNLKPENILFDNQGNVRVTDFGMTRLLHTSSDRAVPRVVTGSIGYLSPEQMADASSSSVSADIYSLGIMFYEMLTGNLPGRRSPLPSEANKDVPKALDDIFDRMTRDDPQERYPDVDALLGAFYEVFEDHRFLSQGQIIMFAKAARKADAADAKADAPEEGDAPDDAKKKKDKKK